MDDKKQQGQQSQQDPKRNPGQGTDQGQDKGQQQRQGQHDMPKPGKDHYDEHAEQTDRGGRTGAKIDKT